MANLRGECLCGKIRYEYSGATGNLVHCHCSKCRKWHGAAFRSRMVVKKDGYRLTQGESYLAQYQASANVIKTFCRNCGSNLATIYPQRDNLLGLPIAGCEGELDHYQEFHIFTSSKAPWWKITDHHSQYEELPGQPEIIHCLND
ncbi:MAG: GFA family protein [Cyanobacteria bacterium J06642_3]